MRTIRHILRIKYGVHTMTESMPWWVTSDPDHPVNVTPEPEPVAPKPVKAAKPEPIADEHPSSIPPDLIPAQFLANREGKA